MYLLVFLFLGLAPLLKPADSLALTVCAGERIYLKPGEQINVQFNPKPRCLVSFITIERGSIDRQLQYPSGQTITGNWNAGDGGSVMLDSQLPSNIVFKAGRESVIRFLANQPAQAPTGSQRARPTPSSIPVQMRLYNAAHDTVTYYWVNPSGREIFYGNLIAGESVTLNTFDGHVWRIKRRDNNQTMMQFTASPSNSFVSISAPASATAPQQRKPPPPQVRRPSSPWGVVRQMQRPFQTDAVPMQPSGGSIMSSLWSFLVTVFWLSIIGGLIYAAVRTAQAAPSIIFAHWHTLIENLQNSSQGFYESVESSIIDRQVPQFRAARIGWPEGGMFSARREYLRIKRKDLIFDICAAPFGTGFFVSWWLGQKPGFLGFLYAIPIVGQLFQFLIRPLTYYKIDTARMFQTAVHAAVLEVIDGITTAKGLRALSELDRKPIVKEFFQR